MSLISKAMELFCQGMNVSSANVDKSAISKSGEMKNEYRAGPNLEPCTVLTRE
jgi:hypothetical protein